MRPIAVAREDLPAQRSRIEHPRRDNTMTIRDEPDFPITLANGDGRDAPEPTPVEPAPSPPSPAPAPAPEPADDPGGPLHRRGWGGEEDD